MAELTYTLGEHPQIIELLSVLEKNNLQRQKEEVQLHGKKTAAHANGTAAGGTAQGVGTGSLVCRSQRAVFRSGVFRRGNLHQGIGQR